MMKVEVGAAMASIYVNVQPFHLTPLPRSHLHMHPSHLLVSDSLQAIAFQRENTTFIYRQSYGHHRRQYIFRELFKERERERKRARV
jgi:hypothetical protein